jgi:hypothetical protein
MSARQPKCRRATRSVYPLPCGKGRPPKRSEGGRGGVFLLLQAEPHPLVSLAALPTRGRANCGSLRADHHDRLRCCETCKIVRGFVSAPGRRLLPCPSDKIRGVKRREAQPISPRLAASRPLRSGRTPLGAPRAAFFVPGPRFPGRLCRPDQPAPGGGTVMSPRRSPGSPGGRLTKPARRSRIPLRQTASPVDALE